MPVSADRRKFCASFSVRIGTRRMRFELSPASLHGGPEGAYRVRVDRRWHDGPDGQPAFFFRDRLAALLADAALGELSTPPEPPALRDQMRVSVVRERRDSGEPFSLDAAWTSSPPILAHDGRWMIAVLLPDQGRTFVPCDDVIAKEGRA